MFVIQDQHIDSHQNGCNTIMENSQNIKCMTVAVLYLVQNIIKTLIQIFQVQKNHCPPNLHTYFNLVDISAHLRESYENNSNEQLINSYPIPEFGIANSCSNNIYTSEKIIIKQQLPVHIKHYVQSNVTCM